MPSGRKSRAALGALILVGWLGVAMVTGNTPEVGAVTQGPAYSATGVCVGGTPEFAFSFTGFPIGQTTDVNLILYDDPDETGNSTATRRTEWSIDGPFEHQLTRLWTWSTRHFSPSWFVSGLGGVRDSGAESDPGFALADSRLLCRHAALLRNGAVLVRRPGPARRMIRVTGRPPQTARSSALGTHSGSDR